MLRAIVALFAKKKQDHNQPKAESVPEKIVTPPKSSPTMDITLPDIDFAPSKGWSHIILHHSATPDQSTHDWEAIRRFHTSYRIDGVIVTEEEFIDSKRRGHKGYYVEPWSDIGYHFGIEVVNSVLKVFTGRLMFRGGAHCKGMNFKALGICFVGNYDKSTPSADTLKAGVTLVSHLIRKGKDLNAFNISVENVQGHRDYAQKTCPGERFDVASFCEDVKSALA